MKEWSQTEHTAVVHLIASGSWDSAAELLLRLGQPQTQEMCQARTVARLIQSDWIRTYPVRRGVGFSKDEVAEEVLSNILARLSAPSAERASF